MRVFVLEELSEIRKFFLFFKLPLIGKIEENLIELKQEHSYLVEGNYKIIYRVIAKDIYITDVFDCRQNPQKIKSSTFVSTSLN